MIYIKILVQVFLFIFPWFIRKLGLRYILKFKIEEGARIGLSIVLARQVYLEEGSAISNLTFINQIDLVHLKPYAMIGRRNWITGIGTHSKASFKHEENRRSELIIGEHSRIVDRHIIDCNGGVYIGSFCTIAGNRSQILTHSIDVKSSTQRAKPVKIGDYCFIGTGCIILMDTVIPSFSILAAGSVLTKAFTEECALYGGSPARFIKSLDKDYEYFKRKHGNVS